MEVNNIAIDWLLDVSLDRQNQIAEFSPQYTVKLSRVLLMTLLFDTGLLKQRNF